jgi:hypothetical protein
MENLGIDRILRILVLFGIGACTEQSAATSSEGQDLSTSSARVMTSRAADGTNDGTQCPGSPMTYHGGPVVHNAQIHPIFWQPNGNANWTALAGQTQNQVFSLVDAFVTDFSAFPMFQTMAEYPDSSSNRPTSVTLSNSYNEYYNALPRAGTTIYPLQESDITSAIDSFVSSAGLPGTTDDLYVLFMPTNVHFCTSDGQCTFPPPAGGGVIGGWHSVTPGGRVYAVIGSEDTLSAGSFAPVVQPSPNGQPIDTMYNVLSHEVFEALTDPRGDGWFGPNSSGETCFENGDRCTGRALSFNVLGSSTLFTRNFDIQEEWSNATASCGLENPHVTSISPSSGLLGGGTGVGIAGVNFAPGMTIPGVNLGPCSSTFCTGTMQPGPAPGAITLWARVTDTSDPSVSDILDVNPTATFTYNAPPAAPSCAEAMACPASYGPEIMTVSCASTVQFYLVDSYTGSASPFPGTNTSMQYTTQTYPNNSIVACAPGTAPSQYGPSCATFSTYESTLDWCGPPPVRGKCKAPLHDCGDGVCVRLCT